MRFAARILLIALALALIGLALTPKALPAQPAAPATRLATKFASDSGSWPTDSMPFTTLVRIGQPPCNGCPPRICPGRPIPLHLAGLLPNDCNWSFEKLELFTRRAGEAIAPPVVRLTVRDNECIDCWSITPLPWTADTTLPGLPAGQYWLPVETAVIRQCSNLPDTILTGLYPFSVPDSCAHAEACFLYDWAHPPYSVCDAVAAPGETARVGMTISSQVALAGLQGSLSLQPAGLRVSGLAPAGPARAMHLAWSPTPDGAKFVMFAERGAPIPRMFPDSNVRMLPPPVILEVSLLPIDGTLPVPVTHLSVHDLLGADSLGGSVSPCPTMTLAIIEARICAGPSCDFNRDGHLDVRDLVTMAHCVLQSGPCPDTARAGLDCNGDGRLSVDDVLCCAHSILRGGERDTTGGRSEPDVSLAFGAPAWTANNALDVPLTLANPHLVGAARLVLEFPTDRYDVASVDAARSAPDWLVLHDVVDGRLVVGVIGLGPLPSAAARSAASSLDLSIRLTPRPGAIAGGEVAVAEAQFSGPDGITLDVGASAAVAALPEGGALALSAARPNPFAGETRLALNLDRGAEADVAVYDLSGRRVALLHHGPLTAGPHEFTWRGLRFDGSRTRAGIYFVQARVNGERLARKVVFLRGD